MRRTRSQSTLAWSSSVAGVSRLSTTEPCIPWLSVDCIRPDADTRERAGAILGDDGDIQGVASAADRNPSNARFIVSRIKRVPLPAQIGLEPGMEVHGYIRRLNADVWKVAEDVACGNIEARHMVIPRWAKSRQKP